MHMSFKKFRWSQVYESSEEELISLLQVRDIDSERVYVEEGTPQIEHHTKDTATIWCAEGSFMVKVGSTSISIQPGDALSLEASTEYSILTGMFGCAYYLSS